VVQTHRQEMVIDVALAFLKVDGRGKFGRHDPRWVS
jgi:hypothetical protein